MKATFAKKAVPPVLAAMSRARRATQKQQNKKDGFSSPPPNAIRRPDEKSPSPFLHPVLEQYAHQVATAEAENAPRDRFVFSDVLRLLAETQPQQEQKQQQQQQKQSPVPRPQTPEAVEDVESEPATAAEMEALSMVPYYNPTVPAHVRSEVAAAVQADRALLLAQRVLELMRQNAQDTDEDVELEKNTSSSSPLVEELVRLLQRQQAGSTSAVTTRKELDLSAGIATTLHGCLSARRATAAATGGEGGGSASSPSSSSSSSNAARVHATVLFPSDVQVNEVLPNGRVVSLTDCTENYNFLNTEENEAAWKRCFEQATATAAAATTTTTATGQPAGSGVYLHLVLHRAAVSFVRVVDQLLLPAGQPLLRREDIQVNVLLDDAACTTQVCSVFIDLERLWAQRSPSRVTDASTDWRQQAGPLYGLCVDFCREWLLQLETALSTWRPTPHGQAPVAVQLLAWRPFPCAPSERSRTQHALLLRGIRQHGGHLQSIALQAATCFPNFFAASHFGPLGCPFRSYHVAAARRRGRHAEALLMAVAVACWAGARPPWAEALLRPLVLAQEDRGGRLREVWELAVPPAVRTYFAAAPAALAWNTVASARLLRLEAATDLPEAGDFVAPEARPGGGRAELALLTPTSRLPPVASVAVLPVADEAAAMAYTAPQIVLPLVVDSAAACEALADLEQQLGLGAETAGGGGGRPIAATTPPSSVVAFRPLLAEATGHPRAQRPWAREFVEAVDTSYQLLTDGQLAAQQQHDFAAQSRGRQAALWPVSKRGRSMADRLPVGLTASAAIGSSSAAARRASRCLALHVTLPADVYLSSMLREFVWITEG